MSLSNEQVKQALEDAQSPEVQAGVKAYYARHREEMIQRLNAHRRERMIDALGAVVVCVALLCIFNT